MSVFKISAMYEPVSNENLKPTRDLNRWEFSLVVVSLCIMLHKKDKSINIDAPICFMATLLQISIQLTQSSCKIGLSSRETN